MSNGHGLVLQLPVKPGGRTGGRPRRLTQEQYEQVGRLLAGGVSRRRQVALIFDIGLSTLYRYYPASVSEK